MERKRGTTSAIEYKWDGRIRSARELFRLMHDFLDKYGYEHQYHELRDIAGAIEDTATFWDDLKGKKDFQKRNKAIFFVGLGLLLGGLLVSIVGMASRNGQGTVTMGVILLVAGLTAVALSKHTVRRSISLHLEGETYRARAAHQGSPSSEVLDVVSNCRVVFTAKVGNPQKNSVDVSNSTTDSEEWSAIRKELHLLVGDFEKLRPKIQLPQASSPPGISSPDQ